MPLLRVGAAVEARRKRDLDAGEIPRRFKVIEPDDIAQIINAQQSYLNPRVSHARRE